MPTDEGEDIMPEPPQREKLMNSHKVWGKIEPMDSECSSSSLNQKVAVLCEKISFASISGSSSSIYKKHLSVEGQLESGPVGEDVADLSSDEEPDSAKEDLATPGSKLHHLHKCKPCHFFRAGYTCKNGSSCDFCHFHFDAHRKRPGKRKRAKLAARAAQAGNNQPAASSKTILSL
mmetsp:Transcript_12873/g.17344  ORF Transcript_12873/g.17344 Transcript_12873/m.17344 type:complete len:176 (-) Transcript_12873:369-896(-)